MLAQLSVMTGALILRRVYGQQRVLFDERIR